MSGELDRRVEVESMVNDSYVSIIIAPIRHALDTRLGREKPLGGLSQMEKVQNVIRFQVGTDRLSHISRSYQLLIL
jgi:hypothetical protein